MNRGRNPVPAGIIHVRPHPGPLPEERENDRPTHRNARMPVVGWSQVQGFKARNLVWANSHPGPLPRGEGESSADSKPFDDFRHRTPGGQKQVRQTPVCRYDEFATSRHRLDGEANAVLRPGFARCLRRVCGRVGRARLADGLRVGKPAIQQAWKPAVQKIRQ
jgi:hypothetical protein